MTTNLRIKTIKKSTVLPLAVILAKKFRKLELRGSSNTACRQSDDTSEFYGTTTYSLVSDDN